MALGVSARYLASTLLCRIILMYEIAGMRETVTIEDSCKEDDREDNVELLPMTDAKSGSIHSVQPLDGAYCSKSTTASTVYIQ